ncbi:MAG: molybdopterin-dependent oxidoreductase [Acidobacteriota bacterium]|nr:molybdopterin-dependent oxidoreductase [Acidobacteriota bacterium]
MSTMLETDRRGFLQLLGGGFLVLFSLDETVAAQESGRAGRHGDHQLPEDVAAWLHIATDGTITAFTGKVEFGQNIRTSLTQAVADELRCDPGTVRLVMGDTSLTPWDAGTFGSRTTPTMAPELRKMASSARESLVDEASKGWSVDRTRLQVSGGCVTDKASGKKSGFGELAAKIDWVTVIGKTDYVTPAARWQVAGTSLPKVNAREIVSGKHKYTSDHKLPGMLYGRVLRPPSFGAKLISADTSAAAGIAGVKVARDGDFIAVAATDEQKAQKALLSIEAKWEQQKQLSANELISYIRENANGEAPRVATAEEAHAVQSNYTVAYIAHVPLEPRATVAEFQNDKLTVWTGTQRPFGVRGELASALQMPEQQIRVLVPDAGSGYGGKHSGECAVEAARIAKIVGKPVKLIWTREEEFTWAYFRPAGIIDVRGAVRHDGTLQSWDFHNYMSGPSGRETPYEVPNKNEQFHPVKSILRDGSYRGLASTANHFARESHMDELAAAVGMDPLAFRLKNLKNERLVAVLKAATDLFQWSDQKAPANRGFGLSCGTEKGGYVACCVEVSVGSGKQLRVERVVQAWECGAIVNPEHLKNQVEGAIVMGLGGALFEAIDFANGRILNPRLSQYRVPRFSDAPKIELVLIDRKDIPSAGAGEIPIVGIAPAIANAIFSATKVRIRSMPILPSFRES